MLFYYPAIDQSDWPIQTVIVQVQSLLGGHNSVINRLWNAAIHTISVYNNGK